MPQIVLGLPVLITTFSLSTLCFVGVVGLELHPSKRSSLLVVITAATYLAFGQLSTLPLKTEYGAILGIYILLWFAHITNVLLLEKQILPGTDGVEYQWKEALRVLFNARRIGTMKQCPDLRRRGVHRELYTKTQKIIQNDPNEKNPQPNQHSRNTTAFNSTRHKHGVVVTASSSGAESRNWFLLRRVVLLLAMYTIRKFYQALVTELLFGSPQFPALLHATDFTSTKQSYFRRLPTGACTTRELWIRVFAVFDFHFRSYAVLTYLYTLVSIISVGILRIDNPEQWPPLFGSIKSTNSMRGFWGDFWHSLGYSAYVSWSKFITLRILRFRSGSNMATLVIRFLVFLLSGVVHILVAWQFKQSYGVWRQIAWSCQNFTALVVEAIVLRRLAVYFGAKNDTGFIRVLGRIAGHAWVFAFFFWAVPKLHYPLYYNSLERLST
jgi:hypothetical protein